MSDKTEIKKLIISINGREETMSIEDARNLHRALSELFGANTVSYPIYVDRYMPRPYRWWESPFVYTTCQTDLNVANTTDNTTLRLVCDRG